MIASWRKSTRGLGSVTPQKPVGLILLLQYTGAVLRVIAASHLPVEMEYQEVEKHEHPIHKQGQPGRACLLYTSRCV